MTTNMRKRGPDKEARGKSRQLDENEFEALLPFLTRYSERSIKAARMAMVEGRKFEDVASEVGWETRQAVDRVVRSVWAIHQKLLQARMSVEND